MAVNMEIVKSLVQAATPCSVLAIDVDDLPGDWRVVFEERAAVMEYEGGLPKEQAEAGALSEVVRQMQAEKA